MAGTKAVLIVGGSGFIGYNLALKFRENYKVFATFNTKKPPIKGVTFLPLNVKSRTWMKRIVQVAQPDIVVYAAGSNALEWCERNPRDTEIFHTNGPANLLTLSEYYQAKFIYISNCYTFDGGKGNYRETDVVLPLSALGKAKIGGENFIKGRSMNYLILRSSPLLGRGNGWNLSWFDELRMNLELNKRMELPNHALYSFSSIKLLENVVLQLAESGVKNKIFHFGGLTKLSLYEAAQIIAKHFGYDQKLLSVKIQKTSADGRPDDYSLNSSEVVKATGVKSLEIEGVLSSLETAI